jgi:hypothetical protein
MVELLILCKVNANLATTAKNIKNYDTSLISWSCDQLGVFLSSLALLCFSYTEQWLREGDNPKERKKLISSVRIFSVDKKNILAISVQIKYNVTSLSSKSVDPDPGRQKRPTKIEKS